MLERVCDETDQDYSNPNGMNCEQLKVSGHIDAQTYIARSSFALQRMDDIVYKTGGVHRFLFELQRAALGQRQGAQVFDQASQHMSFRQKFRDLGIIAFVDTIEQAFKFALDYSQRRAQFVSDIRHQVTAKPI